MTATEPTPVTRRPITPRTREILAAIVRHTVRTGVPPTIRDLCAAFGISSPNGVSYHLRVLAERGWIEWAVRKKGEKARSRGIVVPELKAAVAAAGAAYLENLGRGA